MRNTGHVPNHLFLAMKPLLLLALLVAPLLAQPHLVIYLSDDHSQVDSSLYGNASMTTERAKGKTNKG